jgi:hypothetical protein
VRLAWVCWARGLERMAPCCRLGFRVTCIRVRMGCLNRERGRVRRGHGQGPSVIGVQCHDGRVQVTGNV